MKTQILFQSGDNQYFQDITDNWLLFLPPELHAQMQKHLNDDINIEIDNKSNYYARKTEFLLKIFQIQRQWKRTIPVGHRPKQPYVMLSNRVN
jgi:queuine/archaeosine tRNA-ribosyltransferase